MSNIHSVLHSSRALVFHHFIHGPIVAWSPNADDIPEEYRCGGYEVTRLNQVIAFMRVRPNVWVMTEHLFEGVLKLSDDNRVLPNIADVVDNAVMKALCGYFFDKRVVFTLPGEDRPVGISDLWFYLTDDNYVHNPRNNQYFPIDLTEDSIIDDDDSLTTYSNTTFSDITEPTSGFYIDEEDIDGFFNEL